MFRLLEEGRGQYPHKLHGIHFTDLPALTYEPLICQCGLENTSFYFGLEPSALLFILLLGLFWCLPSEALGLGT